MGSVSKLLKEFISISIKSDIITENLNVIDIAPHQWKIEINRNASDGGNEANGYGFRVGRYRNTFGGVTTLCPIQVEKDWGKGYDRIPPFKPKDALAALKHGSVTLGTETITADPQVKSALVARYAPLVSKWIGEGVDIVTVPQSSSTLTDEWGHALASALGAKFVPMGLLKDMAGAALLDPVPDTVTPEMLKDLEGSLRRMKASKTPKIHKYFHGSRRQFVTKWLKPSDQFLLDALATGKDRVNVLLADDVVTSGSSMAEAKRAIEREDTSLFNIVGAVAILKMQDSH